MRVTGVLNKRYVGEPTVAAQYLGVARTLLGRMKATLGTIGEASIAGQHRWVLKDGAVILTSVNAAGDFVEIDVTGRVTPEETNPLPHGLLLEIEGPLPAPPLTNQRTRLADLQERFLKTPRLKKNTGYKAGNIEFVSADRAARITYNGAPSRSGFDMGRTLGNRREIYANGVLVARTDPEILAAGILTGPTRRRHLIVIGGGPDAEHPLVIYTAIPSSTGVVIETGDWTAIPFSISPGFDDAFETHGFFSASGQQASIVSSRGRIITLQFSAGATGDAELVGQTVDSSGVAKVWVALAGNYAGSAPVVIRDGAIVAHADVPIACDYSGEALLLAKARIETDGGFDYNRTESAVFTHNTVEPEKCGVEYSYNHSESGSAEVRIGLVIDGLAQIPIHRHMAAYTFQESGAFSVPVDSFTGDGSILAPLRTFHRVDSRGVIAYLHIPRRIALIGHAEEETESESLNSYEAVNVNCAATDGVEAYDTGVLTYTINRVQPSTDNGRKRFTASTDLRQGGNTLREATSPEEQETNVLRRRSTPILVNNIVLIENHEPPIPPDPTMRYPFYSIDRLQTGIYTRNPEVPSGDSSIGQDHDFSHRLGRPPAYLGTPDIGIDLPAQVQGIGHIPVQSRAASDFALAYKSMDLLWGVDGYTYPTNGEFEVSVGGLSGLPLISTDVSTTTGSTVLYGDAYLDGKATRHDLRRLFGHSPTVGVYRITSF